MVNREQDVIDRVRDARIRTESHWLTCSIGNRLKSPC